MTDQIISKEGYEKLEQELEHRTKTLRREIADRIQRAKEMGDLSENAEYSEAKDAQAFNEGRVIELTNLVKNLTIVGEDHKETVGMGSIVTVKVNGNEKKYTIVSFNEVNPIEGKISNESPLGVAFLGKKKGAKVIVETPKGKMEYDILKVQ